MEGWAGAWVGGRVLWLLGSKCWCPVEGPRGGMPVCTLWRPLTHGAVRPTLGELCPQGSALRFPMPPPWAQLGLLSFTGEVRVGPYRKPLVKVQAGCGADHVGKWPWPMATWASSPDRASSFSARRCF